MKTIHRRKLHRDFTTLPNILLREKRLSFKARGLLAMMLSHSEEWNASLEWLEGQGAEGREAIRSAVKELEEMGYAVNVSSRENGQFLSTWTWYDEPVTEEERSNHRTRQLREAVNGKPSTVNRSRETVDGNQHPQKEQSQKIIKEELKTEPPSPQGGKGGESQPQLLVVDIKPTPPPPTKKPSKPVKPVKTDEQWLAELCADPTYAGIDVMREYGKMRRWCEGKFKVPTRVRFTNWINRVEKPMGMTTNGASHAPKEDCFPVCGGIY